MELRVSITAIHGISDLALAHQETCLWPLPSSPSTCLCEHVLTGARKNPQEPSPSVQNMSLLRVGMTFAWGLMYPSWDQRWQIGPSLQAHSRFTVLSVDPLSNERWALHPG